MYLNRAREILVNENLIAINQDKLGIMGKQFLIQNNVQMWSKPLTNDRTAFVFMYPLPYGTPQGVNVSLNALGLIRYSSYDLYESFSGKLIGTYKYNAYFSCNVNPSGGVFAFWAQATKTLNGEFIEPLPYMSLRPFTIKP